VVIKFNLTPSEFESKKADIQAKLAQVSGVPTSSVLFKTYSAVSGSRRLLHLSGKAETDAALMSSESQPLLEISAHILVHPGTDLAGLIDF
jgi:hypothetical protein